MAEVRVGLWALGLAGWLFGLSDRGYHAFHQISVEHIVQVFTAAFFCVCWLFLMPGQFLDEPVED